MDERIEQFGHALAQAALAQDWSTVQSMLAPWVPGAQDVDAVRTFFEDDYRSILEGSGIQELHYPVHPYVSGNSSTLAELKVKPSFRPAPRPISESVTDDNFRYWMTIQLQCSDEQQEELELDFLTEFWLIVVELDGQMRVGYWSHDPY